MRPVAIVLVLSVAIVCPPLTLAKDAPTSQPAPDVRSSADACNQFALEFYKQLNGDPGNLVFSPYSIDMALMMTSAGARGTTNREIRSVLHVPQEMSDTAAQSAQGRLLEWMRSSQANAGTDYQLHIANALWSQQETPPLPQFIDLLRQDYASDFHGIDFSNPVAASGTINDWVSRQTAGKIPDLISPSMLPAGTRLVLANAIYFKGTWQSEFSHQLTRDADFHAADGSIVTVPTMHRTGRMAEMENDRFQALELFYKGGDFSMLIVLPRSTDGLRELESSLNPSLLTDIVARLESREVALSLPKFKMTRQLALVAPLRKMGINRAFTAHQADFSGIDGTRDLFISDAVHKVYLAVDEQGTEAAAATGIIMMPTAVMATPCTFDADHPFFFAIREQATGVWLFAGRVQNPMAK